MLSWKLSVLKIPLDKELTANCLVETRTKLEELIPAVMVNYGLNRVQLPLWLQQSLINSFSWYGLSWATVAGADPGMVQIGTTPPPPFDR